MHFFGYEVLFSVSVNFVGDIFFWAFIVRCDLGIFDLHLPIMNDTRMERLRNAMVRLRKSQNGEIPTAFWVDVIK